MSFYPGFDPQQERGGGQHYRGIHYYSRGRYASKRRGSGKRRHLGDHITDSTYTGRIETEDRPCELTKRILVLREEEHAKAIATARRALK